MPKKSSTPNRAFKVADQIQRDLTELIRELKDPRLGMVTLQAVEGQPLHALFPTQDALYTHMVKYEGQEWVDDHKDRLNEFYDFTLLAGHEAYLGMGEHDAQPCSGDSGGPLVQSIDGKLTVVAVVSGSFKGGTYPCSTLSNFGPAAEELDAAPPVPG